MRALTKKRITHVRKWIDNACRVYLSRVSVSNWSLTASLMEKLGFLPSASHQCFWQIESKRGPIVSVARRVPEQLTPVVALKATCATNMREKAGQGGFTILYQMRSTGRTSTTLFLCAMQVLSGKYPVAAAANANLSHAASQLE